VTDDTSSPRRSPAPRTPLRSAGPSEDSRGRGGQRVLPSRCTSPSRRPRGALPADLQTGRRLSPWWAWCTTSVWAPSTLPRREAFYIPWRQNAFADLSLALAARSSRRAVIPELRRTSRRGRRGTWPFSPFIRCRRCSRTAPAVFATPYPVWLLGVFAAARRSPRHRPLRRPSPTSSASARTTGHSRSALGARPRTGIRDVRGGRCGRARRPTWWAVLGCGPRRRGCCGAPLRVPVVRVAVLPPRPEAAMLVTALLALLVPARPRGHGDPIGRPPRECDPGRTAP
jgi:hypothetical protein